MKNLTDKALDDILRHIERVYPVSYETHPEHRDAHLEQVRRRVLKARSMSLTAQKARQHGDAHAG